MTLCFADKEIRRNRAEAMSKGKKCCAAVRNRTNKQITSQTHLGMQLAFFHMIILFCIIESQAFASMIYLKIKCTVA